MRRADCKIICAVRSPLLGGGDLRACVSLAGSGKGSRSVFQLAVGGEGGLQGGSGGN